jgi:hypothetical protein
MYWNRVQLMLFALQKLQVQVIGKTIELAVMGEHLPWMHAVVQRTEILALEMLVGQWRSFDSPPKKRSKTSKFYAVFLFFSRSILKG